MPKSILLLVAALGTIAFRDGSQSQNDRAPKVIPNPQFISIIARSNISLITDLYWIRMCGMALQVRTPEEGKQFLAWAEFVTDLDPSFYAAYLMGSVIGVTDQKFSNATQAEALLTKGVARVPRHELSIMLAYLQLQAENKPSLAARTLRDAAKLPGAPNYLGLLATRLFAVAGEVDLAKQFAADMAQNGDGVLKELFTERLEELNEHEALTRLEQLASTLRERQGRAASLQELRAAARAEGGFPEELLERLEIDEESGAPSLEGFQKLRIFFPKDP